MKGQADTPAASIFQCFKCCFFIFNYVHTGGVRTGGGGAGDQRGLTLSTISPGPVLQAWIPASSFYTHVFPHGGSTLEASKEL